jgi:pSer/pThr/pTyr-binding forkhead associated (FHA) protein
LDITLEFISGELKGRKFEFSDDSVSIGRSGECDLTLDSDLVSYEHCRFTTKADGLYLTDLGSSNGTLLNGNPHTSGFVSNGDTIMFGDGGLQARVSFMESVGRKQKRAKTPSGRVTGDKLTIAVEGGKTYKFSSGTITIGRDPDCDISIEHSLVSRNHAEIKYKSSSILLRDENSTNGTFVNGDKVSSRHLNIGDRVMFGDDGPVMTIGQPEKVRKAGGSGVFKVVISIVLLLLIAGAGYKYIYPLIITPPPNDEALYSYVEKRLKEFSKKLGDEEENIPQIFVESVVHYIGRFTGVDKTWFENSLERSKEHMGMVTRILRGEGLPEEFAYLAFVESGYITTARSSAKAVGLWQFLAGTARDMGLRVKNGIDERTDPKKSTKAACKYIKQLYNLNNSYMLAMASYNTGRGRVARQLTKIDEIGVNRFWYMVKKDMLHKETIGYVPKIMAAMIIGTDLEKFGFEEYIEEK